MSVTVKHIFTRSSLHDMFWFEVLDEVPHTVLTEKFINKFSNIESSTRYDYNKVKDQLDKVRPDIKDQIESNGEHFDSFWDPLSKTVVMISTIESIESFRTANREVYDIIETEMLNVLIETNNTITEEVYDEQGNFIEYGLFNMNL